MVVREEILRGSPNILKFILWGHRNVCARFPRNPPNSCQDTQSKLKMSTPSCDQMSPNPTKQNVVPSWYTSLDKKNLDRSAKWKIIPSPKSLWCILRGPWKLEITRQSIKYILVSQEWMTEPHADVAISNKKKTKLEATLRMNITNEVDSAGCLRFWHRVMLPYHCTRHQIIVFQCRRRRELCDLAHFPLISNKKTISLPEASASLPPSLPPSLCLHLPSSNSFSPFSFLTKLHSIIKNNRSKGCYISSDKTTSSNNYLLSFSQI